MSPQHHPRGFVQLGRASPARGGAEPAQGIPQRCQQGQAARRLAGSSRCFCAARCLLLSRLFSLLNKDPSQAFWQHIDCSVSYQFRA